MTALAAENPRGCGYTLRSVRAVRMWMAMALAGQTFALAAEPAAAQAVSTQAVTSAGAAVPTFPIRPITLIVPSGPGGPLDITARTIQPGLSRAIGQPVIVENRPGASNKIAIQTLLRAPRDGHTIAVVSPAAMTIHPLLDSKAGWDPLRDFTPLIYAVDTPAVVSVHPSVPARTLAQLAAWIRANPNQATYATGGNGTSVHLSTAELLGRLGVSATHVAYKGDPPAFADLLSGQVHLMMPIIGIVKPHVDAGRLIALASSGTERSELMPELPTYRETGIPALADYSYNVWLGFVAAAGIPGSAQATLEEALTSALRQREVSEAFKAKGFRIVAAPSGPFMTIVRAEIERNRRTIDNGGIHAE